MEVIEPDEMFLLDFNEAITANVMKNILANIDDRGMAFVPVISPEKPKQTKVFSETVGFAHGVCLRIGVTGRVRYASQTLSHIIDGLLAECGVEVEDTDLVLDLQLIGQIPGFDANDIRLAVDGIDDIERFRNLVLVGTSIPDTLASVGHDALGEFMRHEWIYWQELQDLPVRRHPSFGDYIVQAPKRPAGLARGVANIRYTARDRVIIARGHKIAKGDHAQYRKLCGELVNCREFRGPAFSWGDSEIATYARGGLAPLGQQHWRAVGTSHHIEDVIDSLR